VIRFICSFDELTRLLFSYRARVYLNGKEQTTSDLLGSFAYHDVKLNNLEKGNNALSVAGTILLETFRCYLFLVLVWRAYDDVFIEPNGTSLSITWVDWNPTPADGSMGLWREVELHTIAQVLLDGPVVDTIVSPDLNSATVKVSVSVVNFDSVALSGMQVQASLLGQTVVASVSGPIAPGSSQMISFEPLKLSQPQLWWPWQMGSPNRHLLKLAVVKGLYFCCYI
jgi:hypothetical protein